MADWQEEENYNLAGTISPSSNHNLTFRATLVKVVTYYDQSTKVTNM